MEQFIQNPNLPEGRVTLAAVSGRDPELIQRLGAHGVRCIAVPPCPELASPVRDHPDMVLHHLGGSRILVNPYHRDLICQLEEEGFELIYISSPLQPEYPFDIRLNCVSIGNYLIGNLPFAEEKLLVYLKHFHSIVTRQGYAKCSCAVVNSKSVITTDRGIEKELLKNGFDVLYVDGKTIRLDGYSHGLIGGCCGKVSPSLLCFTGKFSGLSEEKKISSFLQERGVKPVFLTDGRLTDIGSVIPLKEDLSIPIDLW